MVFLFWFSTSGICVTVASLLKPVKARPTWVKDPSKKALALADKIAQEAKVGVAGFIRPVDQTWAISSRFGPRWGRNHNGVDLAAPTGEPVLAADAGEVTFAGWEPSGYGYLVEVVSVLACPLCIIACTTFVLM